MPTPVMTISDLTENINVTQSENKYHPPFHLKNLPKLAEHGWYLWRHKREKASKSRLRPIGIGGGSGGGGGGRVPPPPKFQVGGIIPP